MSSRGNTLVILTPAFAASEEDNWLPSQAVFVRSLNKHYPELKVIIIAFRYPLSASKRYSWHGNTVVAIGRETSGKFGSLLLWKRAWSELRRIKAMYSLAGIFSFFCGECAFVGHYFAKRNRLKHYIWILGQDAKAGNRQVSRIKPRDSELVAISDFLVDEFQRNHGIRPMHTIPIGIEPEIFPAGQAKRTVDLLGAGSLSPLKQYDVFVEVVSAIADRMPGITAAICGGGTEYEALQQLIERKGLGGNLALLGEQSHNDVMAAMQQTKVLLHPSNYEGFGMVCTEALYAGAHVISFCKPMNAPIAHWHIAADKQEMIETAFRLLQDKDTEFSSVLPFKMADTVHQIMELYGYGLRVNGSLH